MGYIIRKPANKTPWATKRESFESAIRHVNKTMHCKKTTTEETKIRREIQQYIIKKLKEGRSREDIIKRLWFVYGGKQYAKYQPYFKTWVDNYRPNEKSDEGEER